MNASNGGTDDDTLSVKDIQNALHEETRSVTRAADLRIRELTNLSNQYASGELSSTEATEKYLRFLDKWGDPFPGLAKADVNLSDEQIHQEMDRHLASHAARVQPKRSR